MAGLVRPRILLVEPNQEQLLALSGALKPCGYEVFEARSGEEGLNVVRNESIDLVVLAWDVPGLSGAELLAMLKEFDAAIEVLVVGKKPSANDLAAALRGRAADFLVKPIAAKNLRAAIEKALLYRARMRVGKPAVPGMAARLATLLSDREAEVMRLVAAGMNNKEVGRRLQISEKTVRNHMSAVYAKLGVTTRGQAVAAIQGPERHGVSMS